MMTYEYRTLYVGAAAPDINALLNAEGAQGWKLATLIDRPAVCYVVLERTIAPPDPPRTVAPAVGRKKAVAK